MRAAFGKTRTLPAAQIAEPCPTGPDPLFSNQDQVEDAAARRLTELFTQAHSAPINSGQLFDNVGILADTPAAGQILRDEYEYPTDVDPATKSLLQEAPKSSRQPLKMVFQPSSRQKTTRIGGSRLTRTYSLPNLAFILGTTRLRRTTNISLASRWRN